ncbi:DUF221-domain-containing protein [Teratosphaeria nubilosa]|uniref:DUF221-domain-containing protein n=1 Tax=Teratosphaeria nubilosa TaxID=161662 RepID=A0A6G1LD71_9PEZI|nr:DUF221-domain-containing protein [Teratosphaeria nubilosa]
MMDAVALATRTPLVGRADTTSSSDTYSESTINCDESEASCKFLQLIANGFTSGQVTSSALASSAILSLIVGGSLALLFCALRPFNSVVYAPRAKYSDQKHAPPPVTKGMFGWVPPLIRTKEQDLVERVGLDAALFMRCTRMLRSIFACLAAIGCAILIPVNLVAGSGQRPSGASNIILGFTPKYNYAGNSGWWWTYVVVAYLVTIIICFFLWTNYRAVVRLRRQYFDSSEYQRSLHARTLLLTDLPKERRTDEGIVRLVDEVKATDAQPRAAVARNVKDLPDLVEEHEKAVRELESYLAKYLRNPDKLPDRRPVCKVSKNDHGYSKGQRVDAIEYLTSRIKELEQEIKEVRETVDKRNALPYGFASFESIPDAHSTAYVARKGGPEGSIIRLAPRPNDLVWKNLAMTRAQRNWQNFINNLWVALLTIIWTVPNLLIAIFLSNLGNLAVLWEGFRNTYYAHPVWWGIVQGIASPAITTAFYYFLPAIFRKLCINGGDVTKTQRERHVMHKLFSFFIVNNLVVFSLFSSVFGYIATVVNKAQDENAWKAITDSEPFNKVVQALITVSTYWVSWLIQRNIGTAVDLSQAIMLIKASWSRRFGSPTPRELIEMSAPQPFDYASYYNSHAFYSTVGICIGILQPLALPVTAFYFFVDSFLKKYLLLYVFITKYESGGMFWRTLFNRILLALFLGILVVVLLIATLGQGISTDSNMTGGWPKLAAMAPLPFAIVGFKLYCMRAFDDSIHYYQKGKAMRDSQMASEDGGLKKRKGDRVGVRFGHPVLYKPLMTPMVSSKAQHLLKQIYLGRTSMDDDTTRVAGYSDVYMGSMDPRKPGKSSGAAAPFEIVNEGQMDFEHFKNRPEFRDEAGGDGALYGRAADVIRPGTPSSMGTMTRAGTWDSQYDRSRSESRDPQSRDRSESRDSDRTRVNETEYPRGYHQTPSALREHSPSGSDISDAVGRQRGHFRGASSRSLGGFADQESREDLMSGAARMGNSEPPVLPALNPYAPGYGMIRTSGSTPGDTSYDCFRRGRNL